MKQITIVSGKGGTGKTTITASFAALAKNVIIADCDVDAADLHLLLNPEIISEQEFKGSLLAHIDKNRCTECKICVESCRYEAIQDLEVNPVLCEGCGVCVIQCPENAIILREKISGYAYISKTRYGPMSHAKLNAAEGNSGKLVTLVRNNAKILANQKKIDMILIDGPPGIGCPVIASLTGIDLAVIVIEPTLSGIHDFERILDLIHHFGIIPLVIVNMYDINIENTDKIVESCKKNNVKVIGMIPFDPNVTEAMVLGKTVVEKSPNSKSSNEINNIWNNIQSILKKL